MLKRLTVNDSELAVAVRGKGIPLLLVHGFPLTRQMWKYQVDQFASRGYLVIAPDLRGFGDSSPIEFPSDDNRSLKSLTMCQFADDLAAILDHLEVGPCIFAGLSMGGYIGWEFWSRHSDRLLALIGMDTRAASDSEEVARGRRLMASRVEREGHEFVAEALVPKLVADSGSNAARLCSTMIHSSRPASIAAAQLGMAERRDFSDQLGKITIPSLFICGEHDAITPVVEMREMAAQVPNGRFVEIANAGHMAPLEQPESVYATMESFFHSTGLDPAN